MNYIFFLIVMLLIVPSIQIDKNSDYRHKLHKCLFWHLEYSSWLMLVSRLIHKKATNSITIYSLFWFWMYIMTNIHSFIQTTCEIFHCNWGLVWLFSLWVENGFLDNPCCWCFFCHISSIHSKDCLPKIYCFGWLFWVQEWDQFFRISV